MGKQDSIQSKDRNVGVDDEKEQKEKPTNLWFPFLIIILCILFEYISSSHLPIAGQTNRTIRSNIETFNVKNARQNLVELTSFGPRVTGSHVAEEVIPQYLQHKLLKLSESFPPGVKLEIERQNPSSNFYLDFLGGITNVSISFFSLCIISEYFISNIICYFIYF